MEKLSRQLVLDTAQNIINTSHKAEISLSQIANELGVTHAAIYKYFTNKQALWEEVSAMWFKKEIIEKIIINDNPTSVSETLYSWLYQFANLKKEAYLTNSEMFTLNTKYVDSQPKVLKTVLKPAYETINQIMNYNDPTFIKAEAILSAFTVFSLPTFKETWRDDDYESRFDALWNLIKNGL